MRSSNRALVFHGRESPPSAIEEAPLETVQYSVPSSNPFHSVAQSLSFVSGELVGRRGSRSPSLRLTDPQFSEG